ncbi:MAG: hypothetical protein WBO54_12315 [Thermoanaerobaculia bacterium]
MVLGFSLLCTAIPPVASSRNHGSTGPLGSTLPSERSNAAIPDPTRFDLDYRPESYFEGDWIVQTLARIVGSGRRAAGTGAAIS